LGIRVRGDPVVMSRLKIHIVTLTDAEREQPTGITRNCR
jgi:hypothetical protein